MMIKRIELPKIRQKSLYAICITILWSMWNIITVSTYIFLAYYIGFAEWIKIGIALAVVGSSFALIYIFLVIIPNHIWSRSK